jgi:hypothetical protein
LGAPARNCFLNSEPVSAASAMDKILLEIFLIASEMVFSVTKERGQ